jgi:hypothetical protein
MQDHFYSRLFLPDSAGRLWHVQGTDWASSPQWDGSLRLATGAEAAEQPELLRGSDTELLGYAQCWARRAPYRPCWSAGGAGPEASMSLAAKVAKADVLLVAVIVLQPIDVS